LLTLLISLAFAQDEAEPGLTVIVRPEPEAAFAMLDEAIGDLGYREGRRRDDHVVYRSGYLRFHEPVLRVYDEGYLVAEHSGYQKVRAALTFDRRVADNRKGEVVTDLAPYLRGWQESLARVGNQARLAELPAQLELLWAEGQPLETGPLLATPADRKAALLAFWSSRAETPEGERVRAQVEAFLNARVQTSEHALSAEELVGFEGLDVRVEAPLAVPETEPEPETESEPALE
jgi:hypothetical protein